MYVKIELSIAAAPVNSAVSVIAKGVAGDNDLIVSPMYACAMARLKYSMDPAPLPDSENTRAVYDYYKRIYNTPAGASTYEKFKQALISNGVFNVKL